MSDTSTERKSSRARSGSMGRAWTVERSFDRYGYKDRVFRAFANDAAGKKLLEVGCGLGIELGRLGEFGFDVTGVDLAPKAVELGWRRRPKSR